MNEAAGDRSAIGERIRRMRNDETALFWMRVLLGVAFVWLLVIVLGGDPSDGVPKREAAGKHVRPVDYWRTQGWTVAAFELVVVGLLLATTRFWVRLKPARVVAALAPPEAPRRSFFVLVVAAMLASAVLAWPRMHHSFWDDEEYNIAFSIDGAYVPGPAGGVVFREAELRDTLWWYESPNNHVPHTMAVKLVVQAWKAIASPPHEFVPEPLARAPAFVAGLLAILSAAGLAWRMGYARAGILAAWIIALHPWHLKYTSEARGYSLVMLAMTAMPWLYIRALHHGTWARYATFGVAQFLLLWVNTAQAFHMLLLNLGLGLSLLWLHREDRDELVAQGSRWLSVALLGGLAWVLLMTPNLVQAGIYMEQTRGARDLGVWWWRTVGSYLVAGMSWSWAARGASPLYPEFIDTVRAHPFVVWGVVGAGAAAMLGGATRVVVRGGPMLAIPLVMLLTPPLTWAVAWLQQANAYVWYLVFAVPALALLCALGFDAVLGMAGRHGFVRVTAFSLLLGWFGAYSWVTQWPREMLRARSWKPARESVLLTRPSLDPADPRNAEIITVNFCSESLYYDPLAREIEEASELRTLMREADRRGVPLYVNAGRNHRIEKYFQEMLGLLSDDALFEVVDVLHGYEPPWTRTVWRYRGAGKLEKGTARPGSGGSS